jgi:phospholipase/lecithinase/hemolysin
MSKIPLIVSVFALAISGTIAARPFDRLWVFGDSTVDSGWYGKAPYSGEAKYDAYIRHPSYGVGRPTSSPGPMSVEVLGAALTLSASPQNRGGTNYATGGARNSRANNSASGGFPNAVPTQTQSVLGSYFYCLARHSWTGLNWPTSNAALPFDCSNFPIIP